MTNEIKVRGSVQTINCALCGSNEKKLLYTVDDFRITRCKKCGLTYTENPVPPDKIAELYRDQYFGLAPDQDVRGLEETNINADRLRMMLDVQPDGRVLELGCGTGFFLKHIQKHYEIHGMDISAPAIEYAKKVTQNVRSGIIEDADYPTAYFDMIVLWQVLEHVINPTTTLKKISTHLKPGGVIGLEVPNFNSIIWRINKNKWAGGWHPRFHRFHFTLSSLQKLLEQAGFHMVAHTTSWENHLYPEKKGLIKQIIKLSITNTLNLFNTGPIIRVFAKKESEPSA